ncbi:MAG TPA: F0F1 ATP synthase subunit A [Acidimicrobiales bacterium]|jgi:F-type H+-transporting ATPase subunit a|nr:F0F1 ATP synthase subunit A [Acidimicrobiales bacterium]
MNFGGSFLQLMNPATSISVGEHVKEKIFGQSLDLDTVWATGAALIVVIFLAIALRRQITSGVPGRLQSAWELGVGALTKQVEGSIGPKGASVIPLAATLFVFIFVCNIFTVFGLGAKYEWLAAPNGDINLPLSMAIFVIALVHIASIRARGPVGYVKHYLTQPFPIFLLPFNLFINLVEEIAKPITLALRLFGNLLSGTLMLSLIAFLGVWKIGAIPVGNVLVLLVNPVWKLFDLGIGGIQAFIFALLTILYFDVAMSTGHDDGNHEASEADISPEPELISPVH